MKKKANNSPIDQLAWLAVYKRRQVISLLAQNGIVLSPSVSNELLADALIDFGSPEELEKLLNNKEYSNAVDPITAALEAAGSLFGFYSSLANKRTKKIEAKNALQVKMLEIQQQREQAQQEQKKQLYKIQSAKSTGDIVFLGGMIILGLGVIVGGIVIIAKSRTTVPVTVAATTT